ncbi:MAG: glycosyltransferase family 2 protein [Candidatus Aceula meridiana]|nr:glycosyltransferase family 2 protein [Candidatus Aceula meridiana]
MEKISLSVIIPAYNEQDLIQETITQIDTFLSQNFADYEIIIVDDGSQDETYKRCAALLENFPRLKLLKNEENRGKGFSIKKGVLEASSDLIMFSDADLSTPIEEILSFLPCLEQEFSIAIGSRAISGANIIKHQPFLRELMGKIFNLFVKIFVFTGISDTQCGFKCFKANIAKELFRLQRIERFCFDVETLYLARKKGYKIKELPIRWINRENSRVHIILSPIQMFLNILTIRINDLKGLYEN